MPPVRITVASAGRITSGTGTRTFRSTPGVTLTRNNFDGPERAPADSMGQKGLSLLPPPRNQFHQLESFRRRFDLLERTIRASTWRSALQPPELGRLARARFIRTGSPTTRPAASAPTPGQALKATNLRFAHEYVDHWSDHENRDHGVRGTDMPGFRPGLQESGIEGLPR
jgi:hypothetical protein